MWKSAADLQAEEIANSQKREKVINAKGAVVFATRDIAAGETITADAIELREVAQAKIVGDACWEISTPAGRKTRYGMAKGQMVAKHDLNPYPPGCASPSLKVVKEIPTGAVIKADAVKEIELFKALSNQVFVRSSTAIGKKARKKIRPGQILSVSDIMP